MGTEWRHRTRATRQTGYELTARPSGFKENKLAEVNCHYVHRTHGSVPRPQLAGLGCKFMSVCPVLCPSLIWRPVGSGPNLRPFPHSAVTVTQTFHGAGSVLGLERGVCYTSVCVCQNHSNCRFWSVCFALVFSVDICLQCVHAKFSDWITFLKDMQWRRGKYS